MAMLRRLSKELPRLRNKTLLEDGLAVEDGVADQSSATPVDSATNSFIALLAGPKDSPYEGGVFRLSIVVPPKYPMEPPKIKFETRIFHPNVGRGHTPGAICLDILRKEAWSPALTIEKTLISIASLIADPNPNSPMDSEAAGLFTKNRPEYNRRVKDWVKKYAQSNSCRNAWAADFGKADSEPDTGVTLAGGSNRPEPHLGSTGDTSVVNVDSDDEAPSKRARAS